MLSTNNINGSRTNSRKKLGLFDLDKKLFRLNEFERDIGFKETKMVFIENVPEEEDIYIRNRNYFNSKYGNYIADVFKKIENNDLLTNAEYARKNAGYARKNDRKSGFTYRDHEKWF